MRSQRRVVLLVLVLVVACGPIPCDRVLFCSAQPAPAITAEEAGLAAKASGTVVNTAGRPVADAWLQFDRIPDLDDGVRPYWFSRIKSDAQGRFNVANLRPGYYQLVVGHDDYCGEICERIWIGAHTDNSQLDFRLSEGVTITGRVVAEKDGREQPVAGAVVYASNSAPDISDDLEAAPTECRDDLSAAARPFQRYSTAVSDEDGTFLLRHVAADGSYFISARKGPRHTPRGVEVALVAGNFAEPVVVTLPPEAVLRGRVLGDAGQPIAGARVRAVAKQESFGNQQWIGPEDQDAPPPAVTDDAGRFALGDVLPGVQYVLLVTAEGWAPLVTEPLAGDGPSELALAMSRGNTLSGRVTAAAGEGAQRKPVAGIIVRVVPSAGKLPLSPLTWQADTGPDGRFSVSGLGEGHHVIGGVVGRDGELPRLVLRPAEASIKSGRPVELEIEAVAPVTIRGVVHD